MGEKGEGGGVLCSRTAALGDLRMSMVWHFNLWFSGFSILPHCSNQKLWVWLWKEYL